MEERKAYTVAVGNLSLMPWRQKSNKEFCRILKEECKGFLGVNPHPPMGTLLLFDSEWNARRARNILMNYKIKVGDNVCECFIPAEYLAESR